jgi:hypothetical protein
MKFYVTGRISDNIRLTPEGFLVCVGVPIARTGIQEYGPDETPIEPTDENTMVKIQREEREVFRPETIASFQGKPVTIGHPDEMVNPKNWKELAKGTLQNVRRGENQFSDSLIADLIITDAEAIKKIQDGLREVSCGYEADYEEIGIGAGRQLNIVGNHLALVPEGRAGQSYAIKDHKGVPMSAKEQVAKLFDTAKAEALKAIETRDAKTDKVGTEVISDAAAMAADIKSMKDSIDKLCDAMGKMTPGSGPTPTTSDKEAKVGDDDPMKAVKDMMDAIGKRLDALEGKGADAEYEEETGDEDPEEEVGDEGEEEETGDEGGESMVGDQKARIEILAPGKKFTGKDAKAKALQEAYATKDGKEVLDILTGGKKPNFKSQPTVDSLFVKASEVLKIKRAAKFPRMNAIKVKDGHADGKGKIPTVEEINKKNEEHFAKQRSH